MTNSSKHILDLPNEILVTIFSLLDLICHCKLEQVNSRFRDIVQNTETLRFKAIHYKLPLPISVVEKEYQDKIRRGGGYSFHPGTMFELQEKIVQPSSNHEGWLKCRDQSWTIIPCFLPFKKGCSFFLEKYEAIRHNFLTVPPAVKIGLWVGTTSVDEMTHILWVIKNNEGIKVGDLQRTILEAIDRQKTPDADSISERKAFIQRCRQADSFLASQWLDDALTFRCRVFS